MCAEPFRPWRWLIFYYITPTYLYEIFLLYINGIYFSSWLFTIRKKNSPPLCLQDILKIQLIPSLTLINKSSTLMRDLVLDSGQTKKNNMSAKYWHIIKFNHQPERRSKNFYFSHLMMTHFQYDPFDIWLQYWSKMTCHAQMFCEDFFSYTSHIKYASIF